jgi:hypothetical protein
MQENGIASKSSDLPGGRSLPLLTRHGTVPPTAGYCRCGPIRSNDASYIGNADLPPWEEKMLCKYRQKIKPKNTIKMIM